MSEATQKTDEEIAKACESLTPDMLERIFRGEEVSESQCQRTDALVNEILATERNPKWPEVEQICQRYIGLLGSLEANSERMRALYCDRLELIRRRQQESEAVAILRELIDACDHWQDDDSDFQSATSRTAKANQAAREYLSKQGAQPHD